MNYKAYFVQVFCAIVLTSCSYKTCPRYATELTFPQHIPWALFGNEDDGIYGENANYLPHLPNTPSKAVSWWCRNPFHNFCFYVIGSARRPNSEITLINLSPHPAFFTYSPIGTTVFPSESSCLFIALHGMKPFISLRLPLFECYAGWRERGNFGLKLRRRSIKDF